MIIAEQDYHKKYSAVLFHLCMFWQLFRIFSNGNDHRLVPKYDFCCELWRIKKMQTATINSSPFAWPCIINLFIAVNRLLDTNNQSTFQ